MTEQLSLLEPEKTPEKQEQTEEAKAKLEPPFDVPREWNSSGRLLVDGIPYQPVF